MTAAPLGFTYTEQHRHECEVRWVLAMPSRAQRTAYLDPMPKWRGEAATQRLREAVTESCARLIASSILAPLIPNRPSSPQSHEFSPLPANMGASSHAARMSTHVRTRARGQRGRFRQP